MKTAVVLRKVLNFNAYSTNMGSSYLFSCALHRELVRIPHILWNTLSRAGYLHHSKYTDDSFCCIVSSIRTKENV